MRPYTWAHTTRLVPSSRCRAQCFPSDNPAPTPLRIEDPRMLEIMPIHQQLAQRPRHRRPPAFLLPDNLILRAPRPVPDITRVHHHIRP